MRSRGAALRLGQRTICNPRVGRGVDSLRATSVHWLFVALGAVTALTGIMFAFRAQLGVLNVLLLYLLLTFSWP